MTNFGLSEFLIGSTLVHIFKKVNVTYAVDFREFYNSMIEQRNFAFISVLGATYFLCTKLGKSQNNN